MSRLVHERLTFTEVASFLGVTERARDRVIFTNASRLSLDAQQRDAVRLHLADKFHALELDQLRKMEAWLNQRPAPITRAVPDPPCQTQALADISATLKTNDRARPDTGSGSISAVGLRFPSSIADPGV